MISRAVMGALVATCVLFSTASRAEPQRGGLVPPAAHHAIDVSPARMEAGLERDLAYLVAPVKSRADLEAHMQRASTKSPLNALSPGARARFVESLTFGEKGLSGFDYSELVAELTAKQAFKVLALFGEQHITPMLKNLRVDDELDREIMARATPFAAPKCVTYPFCTGGDPIGTDYEDMKCDSPGTCAYAKTKICTQNC